MKKLLLLLIIPLLSFGQDLTYVPDDGFEYWIENNIEGASNGDINDNYVFTDALQPVQSTLAFVSITQTIPIYDLTGIEDFVMSGVSLELDGLYVSEINLSETEFINTSPLSPSWIFSPSITIRQNQYLESVILPKDTVTEIRLSQNYLLNNLEFSNELVFMSCHIWGSPLMCEISFNGNLAFLSSDGNGEIKGIYIGPELELYSVDLSSLMGVTFGTKVAFQEIPNLSYINLNNGEPTYNWELTLNSFPSSGCSESLCIEVGDPELCENNNDWPQELEGLSCSVNINYASSCSGGGDCASIDILEPSTINKSLIKKIDILGREATNKGFQLHIYDDGSVEKKYIIK